MEQDFVVAFVSEVLRVVKARLLLQPSLPSQQHPATMAEILVATVKIVSEGYRFLWIAVFAVASFVIFAAAVSFAAGFFSLLLVEELPRNRHNHRSSRRHSHCNSLLRRSNVEHCDVAT